MQKYCYLFLASFQERLNSLRADSVSPKADLFEADTFFNIWREYGHSRPDYDFFANRTIVEMPSFVKKIWIRVRMDKYFDPPLSSSTGQMPSRNEGKLILDYRMGFRQIKMERSVWSVAMRKFLFMFFIRAMFCNIRGSPFVRSK